MSKESYLRGFRKAAEATGVDPKALAKYAQSTPVSEYATGMLSNMIIPGSGVLSGPGYILGLIDEADNRQKSRLLGLIPGYAGYASGQRIKTQVLRELDQIEKDKKHKGARPVAHAVAEHIGQYTSPLAATGLGAILGGLATGGRWEDGAIVGGVAGGASSVAAILAASIAAAIRRRRTKEEQIESDKGSILKKYLIPGTAAYDRYKRIGRSQGERDEDSNTKQK